MGGETCMKELFARIGKPSVVVSDNRILVRDFRILSNGCKISINKQMSIVYLENYGLTGHSFYQEVHDGET